MRPHIPMRLIAAVTVCLIMVLATGSKAFAHDQLQSATPAANASVPAATKVVLTYSDTVLPLGTRVKVTGPGGKSATVGAPRVADNIVTQAITAKSPGKYTVAWRAGSADGHPITGSFAFTVTSAASRSHTAPPTSPTAGPSSPTAAPSTTSTPRPSQHSNGGVSPPVVIGVGAIVVVLVLAGGWLLVRQRRG